MTKIKSWTPANFWRFELRISFVIRHSSFGFPQTSLSSRRRDRFNRRDCPRADLRPLAFVPPQNQRARYVNARIGAGDNTNKERERKIVDSAAAENKQRHRCQKYCA